MALTPPIIWSLDQWDAIEFPPPDWCLTPWLPTSGLAMIAGQTGIGKTFFSLGCALTIVSGGELLSFTARTPRTVLYVDGEMNARDVRARRQALERGLSQDGQLDGEKHDLVRENFRYLHYAAQPRGIPDLATDDGQDWMEDALGDSEVLFLDNLSSLVRSGTENDAESWVGIQAWLIYLRGRGKSVVLVHHTGKPDKESGYVTQRGTSKRADVLDAVILVKARQRRQRGFQVAVSSDQGGKHRGFIPWEPNIQVGISWQDNEPTEPCFLRQVAAGETVGSPVHRLSAGLNQGVTEC